MRGLGVALIAVLAIGSLSSIDASALQPQSESVPTTLTEITDVTQKEEVHTSNIQQDSSTTENPGAVQCFLVLAVSFSLVNLILFIVQQAKFVQGKYSPEIDEEVDAKPVAQHPYEILDEATIINVKSSLSFAPTVALLMLFILFRSENHGLNRGDNANYRSAQAGMWIATAGIVILAVDGFLVGVKSVYFSRIIEAMGTLLTYLGYILLLVGLDNARSHIIPFSVAEKCIFALSLLLIVTMVGLKIIQVKQRFWPALSSPPKMETLSKFINETTLEQIRSVSEFVPVFITAFFYLHFRYVRLGEVPHDAEVGMTAATVGVYLQVVAVFLALIHPLVSRVVSTLGILITYVFFIITIYSAIDAGWPAPSIAIEFTIILLFLLAFLKLIIVIVQEVSKNMLSPDTEETSSSRSFARLMKLFQDMMSTTGYALILCVFMLYFHFRALFLQAEEPETYIKGVAGLLDLMYIAVVCIFLQMLLQIIEIGTGPNLFLGLASAVSLVGVNVGLAGITIAAIAN